MLPILLRGGPFAGLSVAPIKPGTPMIDRLEIDRAGKVVLVTHKPSDRAVGYPSDWAMVDSTPPSGVESQSPHYAALYVATSETTPDGKPVFEFADEAPVDLAPSRVESVT